MSGPTLNAARVARFRKLRAVGLEHVEGWLSPKRAARVREWMAEAERAADAPQKVTRLTTKKS